MQNLMEHMYIKTAMVAIICAVVASTSCSAPKGEGFAIYLTLNDISPAEMPALSHIDLADEPVIASSDIITYDATTHEITLQKSAFDRLASLAVPVRGKSFLVCLDKQPVYWGAFWTPISSISFNGVTIWKPLATDQPYAITLELGYPSPDFYKGVDPRNNPEILKSLDQAGKLINKKPATTSDKLPHSMKGYELYSWLENNQWQFALITGTNRNKTLEEIIADSKPASSDGWVQIHVTGVAAIKTVLGELPKNEWVSWLGSLHQAQPSQSSVNLALPDSTTINTLKQYAEQCGLDFSVAAPVSN
jgi:hypothetical protein